MNRVRREKRRTMRAALVCSGSCHAGDLSIGAVLGALLMGALWLGIDQITAALIG